MLMEATRSSRNWKVSELGHVALLSRRTPAASQDPSPSHSRSAARPPGVPPPTSPPQLLLLRQPLRHRAPPRVTTRPIPPRGRRFDQALTGADDRVVRSLARRERRQTRRYHEQ